MKTTVVARNDMRPTGTTTPEDRRPARRVVAEHSLDRRRASGWSATAARAKVACIAIVMAGCVPFAGTRGTPEQLALRARLQATLDSIHAAGRFPGITAGVVLADGTAFGLASGFADTALRVRMTPADRLLQGSVGKTYVSAVALQLVHEGRISLDEQVATYLGGEPWYPRLANAAEVTVRQLMNHTSGIVRYEFKPEFTRDLTANPAKVWAPRELIAYLLDAPAPFAPGQGWEYSDSNYILLGMIIERVTGNSYYAEMQRRLLRPLGLRNTVPSSSRTIPGLAQGYAGADNPFGGTDAMITNGRFAINPQFEWTGGGIASTSEDLARWAKALYEGRAFDPSLMPQALDGVPARLGRDVRYGLGVMLRPTPLGMTYGHSGFFPGYLTEVMYFPDTKVAIAVQVNTSVSRSVGGSPTRFILALAQTLAAGR
jgi:D-alanyl-D-alanine carboxypeptidase